MKRTREEIKIMMESMDLPLAYYQFDEGTAQTPPYVVFFYSQDSDVYADNKNFVDKEQLNVELYTRYRDFDLEKQVEAVLESNDFTYDKQASFIDSEKLYQIAYEMEVIIDESEQ